MSTITKEWLQQTIAEYEANRDELPFGLDTNSSIELQAFKLALASLEAEAVAFRSKLKPPTAIGSERWDYTDHRQPDAFELQNCFIERLYTAPPAPANAEPVAWLWSHRKHPSEVSLIRPEDDERAEGAHWSGWNCQALYAAPPATVSVPDDIDTRMKNAGMLSASEIIAGQPIDAFMKHAGVVDLESLLKWAEMRRAEFLRMQAKYELGDNQKDDMYEWVISHVAAFSELHVNIRAAMLQGAEPVTTAYKLPDDFDFGRFNDVVWLEAVASNPRMHSLTTSTIAMVALELNRKLADGNSPVIPAWQAKAEKMAELHGSSFVVFRNGEPPQCADPTKVIISFTDEGLGHGSAAPQQEVK